MKKNVLFLLLLFIFPNHHYVHGNLWEWLTGKTSAGQEAMKTVAQGLTDTGSLINESVVQHGETIRDAAEITSKALTTAGIDAKEAAIVASDALKTAGIDGKEIVATAGEAAKEASANFGSEATSKIVEVAGPIAKGFLGLATVYQAWSIVGDVKKGFIGLYNWYYPSQESQQKEAYYREKNNYLQAHYQFRHSLLRHQCSPRGASGLPIASEQAAREFALAGGAGELEEMTRTFKKYYSLDDCPC